MSLPPQASQIATFSSNLRGLRDEIGGTFVALCASSEAFLLCWSSQRQGERLGGDCLYGGRKAPVSLLRALVGDILDYPVGIPNKIRERSKFTAKQIYVGVHFPSFPVSFPVVPRRSLLTTFVGIRCFLPAKKTKLERRRMLIATNVANDKQFLSLRYPNENPFSSWPSLSLSPPSPSPASPRGSRVQQGSRGDHAGNR